MEFRRGGHRDERRRRVLIDELPGSEPTGEQASSWTESGHASGGGEAVRRYSHAALTPRQPRVIDLIPTRRWTRFVLAGLLLSGLAGAEALYGYLALGHTPLHVMRLPAIDLAAQGSVITWFSAALLAASAVMGLLIYQIRRYRVDDYRGRYRMWCWLVPLLLLASVDQVAQLQETLRAVLLHVAGVSQWSNLQVAWIAGLALITTVVGGRLLIEMRSSAAAIVLLLIALACHAVLGAARLDWLFADQGIVRVMTLAALETGGHVAFFLALCGYASHVHRDALGQLPPPQARKTRARARPSVKSPQRSTAAAETPAKGVAGRDRASGKRLRVDASHAPDAQSADSAPDTADGSTATSVRKRREAASRSLKHSSKPVVPSADADEQEQERALSKAERRRLRKQKRRESAS